MREQRKLQKRKRMIAAHNVEEFRIGVLGAAESLFEGCVYINLIIY